MGERTLIFCYLILIDRWEKPKFQNQADRFQSLISLSLTMYGLFLGKGVLLSFSDFPSIKWRQQFFLAMLLCRLEITVLIY